MQSENKLVYYKCKDCLSTFTSLENPRQCACDGMLMRMGQVTVDRKRYEEKGRVSICDARCTNAMGPLCNCACGCANHGSKLTHETIVREGVVRIMTVDADAIARAKEWRSILAELSSMIEACRPKGFFWTYYYRIQHVKQLKVHAKRVKDANALMQAMSARLYPEDSCTP